MARARKKPDEQAPETQVDTTEEAAAGAEEPVAEEPAAEVQVPEEPTAEEPVAEEPVAEEPVAEEPVAVEAVEEAATEEPEAPAKPVRKRRAPAVETATAPATTKKPAEKAAKPKAVTRKPRAAAKRTSERKPIVRLPRAERPRGQVRERRGVVVSDGMEKTIVVRVDTVRPDRSYRKVVRRSRKLHAHDERNEAKVGDLVRIVETRPISKTKSWRLAEVIEAAK
jgi:small subunit ribosomal protein S17